MVGSIVHQLTKNASIEEIEKAGLGAYYTDHGVDVYPQSAAGAQAPHVGISCGAAVFGASLCRAATAALDAGRSRAAFVRCGKACAAYASARPPFASAFMRGSSASPSTCAKN